ncbi:MAG: alpha/beta fold hydrolase [Patescibacteria group bacterium]
MPSLRTAILAALALFGLSIGALFAFSRGDGKGFATVEINGASLVAEKASERTAWARGLSGREAIGENQAMLFVFGRPDRYAIWMKEMQFPIDIFWIRNGVVVDMEENVPAPAPGVGDAALPVYRPDADAEMVLETRAGFAKKYHILIGDRIRITEGDVAMGETPEPPPSPEPGAEFTIDALYENPAAGRDFVMGKVIEENRAYQKYPFTYQSGDLRLTGIINVPSGPVPAGGFPVLILNHGLIDPKIYTSGRGSRREQDFFAKHGYVTLHPDYRGHASSSPNTNPHHDFYVGYTRDVMALVDAIKNHGGTLMDKGRIGMWGHSMGGGIAARAAVLSPDIRAYVLFAPISADAEENFYELGADEVRWLRATYGVEAAPIYRRISPIAYFDRVRAPVQFHHGVADYAVPMTFSQDMFNALTRLNKKAEFFKYQGEGHEFAAAWPLAADRALQFFDKYVKGAR